MRIVDIARNDWLCCRCCFEYDDIIDVALDFDYVIVDTFDVDSIGLFPPWKSMINFLHPWRSIIIVVVI